MSNEIQQWSDNLFVKYAQYKSNDTASTNVKELSEDEKELVSRALNATFINPKFKMRHFVSSGQLTPYNTVKQWMLELKSIEEACENFEHMLKKFEIEKEILELRIAREQDDIERRVYQLELEKSTLQYKQNRRRLQQHYIEREQYVELLQEYLEGPNGKTPDGKSWLDVLGTPEEDYYEKEYWTVRLAKQAAMDMAAYGRIGAGNMDAITQLGPDQQKDTIALAHEVSLRVESVSNTLRNEVHNTLLQHDQNYAAMMQGKTPTDLNKIEFNVNDMVPKSEESGVQNSNDNEQDDFLNVYNP